MTSNSAFAAVLCVAVLFLRAEAGHSGSENVSICLGGRLSVPAFDTQFKPVAAGNDWSFNGGMGGADRDAKGVYRFTLHPSGASVFDCTFEANAVSGDGVLAKYAFVPREDAKLRAACVSASFSFRDLDGGFLMADGQRIDFPAGQEPAQMIPHSCRNLEIVRGRDGRRLGIKVVSPEGRVSVQNSRAWGFESFGVRIEIPSEGDFRYLKGKAYHLRFELSGAGSLDEAPLSVHVVSAGSDWIPVEMKGLVVAGSALDFSFLRKHAGSAGRYGRLKAVGAHFEFEKLPGVQQRFYGANLCEEAVTPSKAAGARFAEDFARRGYDSVRFHHHERPLIAGMKDPAALTLNPEAVDRFDSLVANCISNGLYLTTDLHVSRGPIAYRAIGIDRDGNVPGMDYKAYVQFLPAAHSNYLAWVRTFLAHRNPYTSRTLAEEPALICLSLVNEGPLDAKDGAFYEGIPECVDRWRKWLAERKARDPKRWGRVSESVPAVCGKSVQGVAFLEFLADAERLFAERMRKFLQCELGCCVPLANMNNSGRLAFLHARSSAYDYVDDHFYVDHPEFLKGAWGGPSTCEGRNPVKNARLGASISSPKRSFDRPFAVSEYNYCWPGRYRAAGGLLTGTEAALQDWSAIWRFAWTCESFRMGACSAGATGFFDAVSDPFAQASDRAVMCLFGRGDLKPLSGEYAVRLPDDFGEDPDPELSRGTDVPWAWLSWYRRVGTTLHDRIGQIPLVDYMTNTAESVRRNLRMDGEQGLWPVAGDGAVRIDPKRGEFAVSSLRTCGGLSSEGRIRTKFLAANVDSGDATIWASSLDGKPLFSSARILVSHLTEEENDGATFADADRRLVLDHGRRVRVLVKAGRAGVALKCADANRKVYALATDGSRRREIPCEYKDGRLCFTADTAADPTNATFLYEVVCAKSEERTSVRIGGRLGDRMKACFDARIRGKRARGEIYDEAVNAFRTRFDDNHPGFPCDWIDDDMGLWQGEYWGKTMLSATKVAELLDDSDLKEWIRDQARRFVRDFQNADGYLCSYNDPDFVGGLAPRQRAYFCWNVWSRKYTMWALLEAARVTDAPDLADAAARMEDHLIAQVRRLGVSVDDTGAFAGLPSMSILKPTMLLYRATGEKRYLDFAAHVVSRMSAGDHKLPDIIGNAFGDKCVHEWRGGAHWWAKAYEMMSCYEGVVDYAQTVLDDRLVESVSRTVEKLKCAELNPMGSVGFFDHFTHAKTCPNACTEICDVIHWIRLNRELFLATEKSSYLDTIEFAFYNAFLAGVSEDGSWGAHQVRSHGTRHYTPDSNIGMKYHQCCVDNIPRGFVDFAETILTRTARGELSLNFYSPAHVSLDGLEVDLQGDWPISTDVRIELKSSAAKVLRLRVPGWCTGFKMDGVVGNPENGWVRMTMASGERRTVILSFLRKPEVHVCHGPPDADPRPQFFERAEEGNPEMKGLARRTFASWIQYGPILLAKSKRVGESRERTFEEMSVGGTCQCELERLEAPSGVWGSWNATLSNVGSTFTRRVCDFASAARCCDDPDGWFSIWF